MFRKIFTSFMFVGAIALALSLCYAAGANAASESFVFMVGPGQYLVKLVRAVGWKDEDYIKIVTLNPEIWPEKKLYHKSHNFVPVGLRLRVPKEVAVALGLVPWTPTVINSAPVVAPANPFVPAKSAVWPDILLLVLLAFLLAFLLHWALKNDPNSRKVEEAVRRAGETVGRGLRELINCFFPTALQPCVAGGVHILKAATIAGWDPNMLQMKSVFGEYDVNCRLADGSVRSERRVLNGELGYSPRGTNGETVVLKGCGNVARRVAGAHRMSTGERLTRAARRTFRPESLRSAVELPRPASVPAPALEPAPQPDWNQTPLVLRQGLKGKLVLEPVWRVPDPA